MVADAMDADLVFGNRLEERVRANLLRQHYPCFRRLKVEVSDGGVVVEGCVSTFHERQVAIECARRVAGVQRILDRIQVGRFAPARTPPTRKKEAVG
jgi:osmotically-inducible protein OsmY